jgi:hypothetical protein
MQEPTGVVVYTVDALSVRPRRLVWSGRSDTYLAAQGSTPGLGTLVLYLAGFRDAVDVKLARVDAGGSLRPGVVLETGPFPQYMPSVAYRSGHIAAAWTVRGEGNTYQLRLGVFSAALIAD